MPYTHEWHDHGLDCCGTLNAAWHYYGCPTQEGAA